MLRLILRCVLIMIAVSVSSAPQAFAKDKIWHIGFLDLNAAPTGSGPPFGNLKFFSEGLGRFGYEEGRDYVIDARFAHGSQPASGVSKRLGGSQCGCDRDDRNSNNPRRQSGDRDDSDRHGRRESSGGKRSCRQPSASGRKCDGSYPFSLWVVGQGTAIL